MKKIAELVKEAHQNAVNKGWWEEPRTYGELIALVHSEVSEALEDYRNGAVPHATWYEKKCGDEIKRSAELVNDTWKPCGIPSELADICIRIFDIAGHYGFGEELQQACESKGPNWQVVELFPFADNLAVIHLNLSESFAATETMVRSLADALLNTESLAVLYGIDLERAIAEKMAYNATRPQRHGGKVL
ncbi:hypothetical protein PDENDC454_04244 [Paenibacillus dendritiformis C454]|uniref:Uncharacterized protein n=1 Tax=Paenibacillus dendritiformis C454 TaxID=1131935 RepID=H3SBG3_9BACL|nr:hypothetical protein [Paenibacillus dendritiformis]EHQ63646.1 hypothetical protein PDENDC454_04244 [Paenibacillus dendritiformis C454]